MNRKALEQTIRVLEDVQKYKLSFDLTTFVGFDITEEPEEATNYALWRSDVPSEVKKAFRDAMEKEQLILIPHNCGCTACATGYAGLDPWFRERGFKTTKDGHIVFADRTGWSALLLFYELEGEEGEYLFIPHDKYSTPADVIDRIREVLRDGFPEGMAGHMQMDQGGMG